MTFAAHISDPDLALLFYVRISGLPYVWSNAALPTEWTGGTAVVSIGGETYTHQSTLLLGDDLEIAYKAEPWAGIGSSGELDLAFQLRANQNDAASSDPWLGITTSSIFRDDVAVLTADATAAATTLYVDDSSGFSSPGVLYAGLETITYTGTGVFPFDGIVFTGCGRGGFGSMATIHTADQDQVQEVGQGGPYVASHPLTLSGRIVTVYAATGYLHNGTWVPHGTAITDADSRVVFRGILDNWELSDDLHEVQIRCSDLTRVLDEPVMQRYPRAYGNSNGAIYVGPDNNELSWSWSHVDVNAVYNQPLEDTTGSEVSEGFYTIDQISAYVNATIQAYDSPPEADVSYTVEIEHDPDYGAFEDGRIRIRVAANTDETPSPPGEYKSKSFGLIVDNAVPCFWRELGFTESMSVSGTLGRNSTVYNWELHGNRGLPAFRLPEGEKTRWLPLIGHRGLDFDPQPGWLDEEGDAAPGFALVGKSEIVAFDDFDDYTLKGIDIPYIDVSRRGAFGTVYDEEVYYEYNSRGIDSGKPIDIRQVFGIENVDIMTAMLYAITSGSGEDSNGSYDYGWVGAGAYVDDSLIDATSFLDVGCLSDSTRGFVVTETTPIRDLIASELALLQSQLLPKSNGTTYALHAAKYAPPAEVETVGAALDHSNISTAYGVGFERGEGRIANHIVAKNIGYDPAKKTAEEKLTWKNGTSVGTWGLAEAIAFDMRYIEDTARARSVVFDYAQNVTALFGAPFPVLEVGVTRAEDVWLVDVGDLVSLTHSGIPNGITPGWGFPSEWQWAPCMYGSAVATTTDPDDTIVVDDHYFSHDEDDEDYEYFAVSMRVRLYEAGNESTAEETYISEINVGGVDLTEIVLGNATSLTAPIVIEFDDYDDADIEDAQKKYVYMSDDNERTLDIAGGETERAFVYG